MGCEKEPISETSTTNSDSVRIEVPQGNSSCYAPFREVYAREKFEQRWGGLWEVAALYSRSGVLVADHPGDRFYFPTPFQYEYGGYPRALGVFMGADSTIDIFEWIMYKNIFEIKRSYGPNSMGAKGYGVLWYSTIDMDLCYRSKDTLVFGKDLNKERRLVLVRPK